MSSKCAIAAVDFFCGVGGLSLGLKQSGIQVVAGVDIDEACSYPYTANIGAQFLRRDIRTISGEEVSGLFPAGGRRLLAGCAPCQPFSKHRRGSDTTKDEKWTLLDEFNRIVDEVRPEYVTMENVSGLGPTPVFQRFVFALKKSGYSVDYKVCYGPEYGLAQHRRRLVLLASNVGSIEVPAGLRKAKDYSTVRSVIGKLPAVRSGHSSKSDPLHKARSLSDTNLARIRASRPGGTWRDWPIELRSPCHLKESGATFQSVYARMSWDEPSPTITTQSFNFGTGRFGHPSQSRAITLREAAMLQGFPKTYKFVRPGAPVEFVPVGRLIGNAVPPPLAKSIGVKFVQHSKNALT